MRYLQFRVFAGFKILERDAIYVGGLSELNLDCADCFQYKTMEPKLLNMLTLRNNQTKAALKRGVSTQ